MRLAHHRGKIMWYKLKLWLTDPTKNLWLHPTFGALFAIVFSLIAALGNYVIPVDAVPNIEADTVSSLLDIIASSMLAVTTFSLSIMVSAFASASSSATPRAYQLMMADDNTRTAIASFISAFIYSIIAKIALSLQYYGIQGRFVLFVSTILVLIYLVITLIRWVQTLSQLGTLSNAIKKIERSATQTLANYRAQPSLGYAVTAPEQPVQLTVSAEQTGYLTHVDMASLQNLAESHDVYVYITIAVGKFLHPSLAMAQIHADQTLNDEAQQALLLAVKQCFVIAPNRSYAQDPRFGLLVMSEVGQRAMSASINDPATAMAVLNSLTRILVDTQADAEHQVTHYDRISAVTFDQNEFIKPVFAPIARDSVSNLEVNMRMMKCLAIIANNAPEVRVRESAALEAHILIRRCLKHFEFAEDRQQLLSVYQKQFPNAAVMTINE